MDSFQMCSLTKEQQRLNAGAFWPQKSSRAKRHVAWRDIAILHDLLRYIYAVGYDYDAGSAFLSRVARRSPLPLRHNLNKEIYPVRKFTDHRNVDIVRVPGWFGDDLLEWVKTKWIGDPSSITHDTRWKLYYPASPFVYACTTDPFFSGADYGYGWCSVPYNDTNYELFAYRYLGVGHVFSSFADRLAGTMLYELCDTGDSLAVYCGGISRFHSLDNHRRGVELVRQGVINFPDAPVVSATRTRRYERTYIEDYDTGDDERPPPQEEESDSETFSPDDYAKDYAYDYDRFTTPGYGVPCRRERELFRKLMGCNLSDLALPVSSQKIFKRKYNGDFIVPGPSGHMVDACYDAAKCLLTSDLLVHGFGQGRVDWSMFKERPDDRLYTSTMERSVYQEYDDRREGWGFDSNYLNGDFTYTSYVGEVSAYRSGTISYQAVQDWYCEIRDCDPPSDWLGDPFHSERSDYSVRVTTGGMTPQKEGSKVSGQNLSFRLYFADVNFPSSLHVRDNGQPIMSNCRLLLPVTVSVTEYTSTWLADKTYYSKRVTFNGESYNTWERKIWDSTTITQDITDATVWVPLTLRPLASKKTDGMRQLMLFCSDETFAHVVASALGAVGYGGAYLDPSTAELHPSLVRPELPGGKGGHESVRSATRKVSVSVTLSNTFSVDGGWPYGAIPGGSYYHMFTGPIFTASWKPECLDVIWG